MSNNPYDYENREGILPVSWDAFYGLCKGLVVAVSAFQPEIILPIGRGGYYPGTLLAHMLQVEIFPIRLSRRVKDIVTYPSPQWILEPPQEVRGRRVLIVDEISSTGETLTIVREKVLSSGAHAVKSAVLYAHSKGTAILDYIGLISNALILNPWDREIWKDRTFQIHPEYSQALKQQGVSEVSSFLLDVEPIKALKS